MGPPSSPKKPNPPSASALLESESFKPFPEFAWDAALSIEGHPRDWFERRLEEGKPFVVRGFQQSPYWAEAALNTNSLKDLLKGQGNLFTNLLLIMNFIAPYTCVIIANTLSRSRCASLFPRPYGKSLV